MVPSSGGSTCDMASQYAKHGVASAILAFGNINQWSKKSEEYLRNTTHHVVLFAEMHLTASEIDTVTATASAMGWLAVISPASATGRGGNHGGVGIFVRKHLDVHTFDPELAFSTDFACIGLRLKGMNIVIACMYLDNESPAGGLTYESLEKLRLAAICLKSIGLPFVVAADWNITPTQIIACSSWLDDVGADLVRSGLAITCTAGHGREIDYFAVSRTL